MSSAIPAIDACGFVRVPSEATEPLWMTCESCGKSDHFWLDGDVRCRCGARYTHAVRPDGSQVPSKDLVFVPFDQGPKQLADMEWDPTRVGVAIVLVLSLVVGGGVAVAWVMGLMG